MNNLLRKLADRLKSPSMPLPSIVVGFDGFVDEMITVVSERKSLSVAEPVPDIRTFGDLICRAAGHSSLREILVTATHPGGCAINLGDGLAALGVPVDAFATLGQPVHTAFMEVTERFRTCHSWGKEPGRTLAFEFRDGKVMFSAVQQLAEFDEDRVACALADGIYAARCREARLIALTDWTLYPHMTSVWRLLQERVFRELKHHPAFFVDLVDPSSRSSADILGMLDLLRNFEVAGPLILGLNGNEANVLARNLGLPGADVNPADMLDLAATLRVRLAVSEVVIHTLKFAVAADASEQVVMNGSFCALPRKSTGAGDRFNAGYAFGVLLGLEIRSRLALGCGAASFFVREARSATCVELANFLERDYLALDEGGEGDSA